jgi:hypothetical protein
MRYLEPATCNLRSECAERAYCRSAEISLRALAAPTLPPIGHFCCCNAVGKPVIYAKRSETAYTSSQVADFVAFGWNTNNDRFRCLSPDRD